MEKVKNLSSLAALIVLALFSIEGAGCDDGEITPDGDCVDGPADQWGCPDGGDADSDGDSDGDVEVTTLTVETWTIGPDGVERELPGASVELRSNVQTCDATPCDLTEVGLGEHVLLLTLPGWIQEPVHLAVTQDGIEVVEENPAFSSIVRIEGLTLQVRMERDVTGTWERDGTETVEVVMGPPPRPTECPNSALAAWSFGAGSPLLCIEGETVSLCETYAQSCYDSGLGVIEGSIGEDTITFTGCNVYDPEACGEYFYTRVD